MRITNKMMTNNMMTSINKNKNLLNTLDEQYSTGKKIQRPSQDPIVAVRALKLRTNLSELNQYYEKNIPDARSWMDVTEEALKNMNQVMTKINSSCVQGATDSLTASDRSSIVETLNEMKKQIYQEGNANYAGRYVFTGYKTNSSLSFEENTSVNYTITENFTGNDLDAITKISYGVGGGPDTAAPTTINTHRLRLSYENLDASNLSGIPNKDITYVDKNGVTKTIAAADIVQASLSNTAIDPYNPASGKVNYIPETGELILSDTVYASMQGAQKITVDYGKSNFETGDLKPESYFDCKDNTNNITYKVFDQQIQYEINFNQSLTINTQAKDAFDHSIGRDIDEILYAVKDVEAVEGKIAEVKKNLEDKSLSQVAIDNLNTTLTNLQTEFKLKTDIMQDKFNKGILGSKNAQDKLNTAVADLGTRSTRLDLTEDRLSSQQVNFEELMSNNEDADVAETYVRLSSAEVIYNASLNAAGKIVKASLLDFL
ncbi:flagellar hook-associated protein FlgL [Anaerocolumna xylanovorans]|uniref:Flagellar hook-associated protein 3 FlgL n=1 Tax=Anaerocolumna xylanovorans DSM 12503 TaxID=1121345 RepID=A0A1M7Y802_9FIRM|nr:flagellar hook-associated protein FlgL [Anaerocolumna xylanovorans]SHO48740.1 flagellar hook-associated protein 3 FlgL [Anaerocolumna xylanovorans DSM 12503]